MYWDLVLAYEDEQVKNRSLDFANQTLIAIGTAVIAGDSGDGRYEGRSEFATREQDLTIAKPRLSVSGVAD